MNFWFARNGTIYQVQTRVGDGPTQVDVREVPPYEVPQPPKQGD